MKMSHLANLLIAIVGGAAQEAAQAMMRRLRRAGHAGRPE